MPNAGDDDDDFLFRSVWETEDEEAPPGTPPRRQPASAPDYAHPLLAPLARAQHAVTRLDARAEAAAPVIAEGLRARLALREAAGWLAWARFSIHPRDLALRDAGLTGAYGPAALADRLAAQLPATTAQGTIFELAPSDLAVHQALSMARYWRRLAEMRSWRPIADAAAMRELLASIGAGQPANDAEIAEWLTDTSFQRPAAPALIQAGLGARAWMNRAAVKEPLTLDGIFLAACLWRASGFGRAISLPFWLAPETQLNRLGPRVGVAWMAGFLECVIAAATAALGDLDRLQAVADKGQMLTAPTARSKLPAALQAALRTPVVTAAGLAKSLRITPQGALGLLRQLQKAGLIHEATGRASWQGFTIT
jgi:hypothetical protein